MWHFHGTQVENIQWPVPIFTSLVKFTLPPVLSLTHGNVLLSAVLRSMHQPSGSTIFVGNVCVQQPLFI